MIAGKPEKDGAAEGTAGEREKDAVIATDLATALLATALASAQRLHEVRRCQRVCAVTKMMKHVLIKLYNQARCPGPAAIPCAKENGGRESFGWRARGMWTGMADPEKEGVSD